MSDSILGRSTDDGELCELDGTRVASVYSMFGSKCASSVLTILDAEKIPIRINSDMLDVTKGRHFAK